MFETESAPRSDKRKRAKVRNAIRSVEALKYKDLDNMTGPELRKIARILAHQHTEVENLYKVRIEQSHKKAQVD